MADSSRNGEALLQRVSSFVKRQRLLSPGQRLLLACSGGADSTALVDIMRRLAGALDVEIAVLMVDHRLGRGFAAAVSLMRRRCRRWGLPLLLERLEPGPRSETDLRRRRYRLLARVAASGGFARVATGHTRDDQVETVLLRIIRGTGTAGLAGIPPLRDGLFIRPLLEVSHRELCDYLRGRRLGWWEDPANRQDRVPRNRVRRELLPLLRRDYNPGVDEALLRLSRSARRHQAVVDRQADGLKWRRSGGTLVMSSGDFLAAPEAVRARLLVRAARLLTAGRRHSLPQERVEQVLEVLAGKGAGTGITVELGSGLSCRSGGGLLQVYDAVAEAGGEIHLEVNGPGPVSCPQAGWEMEFRLSRPGAVATSAHAGRVFFDARGCSFPLLLRSWRPGDRLRPWGGRGSRKVARLLMDAGIPRHLRWRVPLLCKNERVLWVAGLRRGDDWPVGRSTRSVLEIRLLAIDTLPAGVIACAGNEVARDIKQGPRARE